MANTLPQSGTAAAGRSRNLLRAGYAALITNVGIVVTGGVVRVSGSGLGCAEWPRCEPDSFTPSAHPLEDLHAGIEFGNRLLTFVVLGATLWFLWEVRRSSGLVTVVRRVAWILPLGVLAQAVIGGITVLTGLQWYTVSIHFLASMVLIALAVAGVHALRSDPDEPRAPAGLRHAATTIATIAFLVLILGTFVTAAGPHGGDLDAPRIPISIGTLAIAHAHGVWMLLGTSIVTLLIARQMGQPRIARSIAVLIAISLAQGGIGYLQYWLGIPAELVSLHIVGASLVWLATARLWVVAHRPDLGWAGLDRPGLERSGSHEDTVSA
jgi:heme a synthase